MKRERTIYLDILRIVATFSVILLHVAASQWYVANPKTFDWQVLNFYDSLVRFCVPIFVMISGALFLNRDIKISELFSKYILKIVITYLVWAIIYVLFINYQNLDVRSLLDGILVGHYHLWFLWLICSLYLLVPILREVVKSKKNEEYSIILFFLFSLLIPQIIELFDINQLQVLFEKIDITIILNYVGYFLLGHYINNYSFGKKTTKMIYLLGIVGFLITVIGTSYMTIILNSKYLYFYTYLTVNVCLQSIAIFVFAKNFFNNRRIHSSLENKIVLLSSITLYIYLIHDIFNIILFRIGYNVLDINPLLSVPITAILIFSISMVFGYIINFVMIKIKNNK